MARKPGEELRLTVMPKSFDGTGVVRVQCSEGAFSALKLDQMPSPSDYGQVINGMRFVPLDTRAMGADSVRYRVIWPEPASKNSKKLRTSSFLLSGKHSNETLFVFAEHLRRQGVEFVGLANAHGSAFRSSGLHGSGLAYLSGTKLHSILTRSKLFLKPTPEDSSPARL